MIISTSQGYVPQSNNVEERSETPADSAEDKDHR